MALFALALIWLIALASYSAVGSRLVLQHRLATLPPANFAGRIGAFMAELSYQLLGYAAYLVPLGAGRPRLALLLVPHRSTPRTRSSFGAGLLFGCVSSFLSLAFGSLDISGKTFRAGGYIGDRLAALLAAYLNRTGSIILILTLLFLAIILSTQFSFGRLFAVVGQMLRDRCAALFGAYREWREERRRDKQRQEVIKKHLDKAPKDAKPKPGRRIAATGRRDRRSRCRSGRSRDRPRAGEAEPRAEERRRSRRAPPRWSERPRRR